MMTSVDTDYVTLVSGLPRSGTSMMMRMLEAGGIEALTDNLRTADEDNPNGYYELEVSKQRKGDKTWLDEALGKAVKVIYLLLYDLPADRRYKVIFMRREIAEVVASQDVMLRRKGVAAGGPDSAEMAKLLRAQVEKFYEWVGRQEHIDILTIDYGDVLSDPAGQVLRIDEFLGRGLDRDAMARICDPSLYRNRR
jgi:hypothetical protein